MGGVWISEVESEHLFYDPDKVPLPPPGPRTPGTHLSTLVQDWYYIRYKGYAIQPREKAAANFEAGYSWEELIENAYATREGNRTKALLGVDRPGELLYDGVYMTPDGHRKEPNEIHEYKFTTRSAKMLADFDENFLNYNLQATGYCRAVGTNVAVFWIMMVKDTILDKETQTWKAVRVYNVRKEFDEAELDHNWKLLKSHEKWMKEQGLL